MDNAGEDEEAGWIVAEAAVAGARITRRQLSEWHRRGLIPAPKRHGLGRGKGSASWYPAGALPQVLACERLQRVHADASAVGWALWKEGFKVGQQYWREPFDQALKNIALISTLTEAAADQLISYISKMTPAPEGTGSVRRRLGSAGFQEWVAIALSVANGDFNAEAGDVGDQSSPAIVFSRFLGTSSKRNEKLENTPFVLEVTASLIVENLRAMASRMITFSDISVDRNSDSLFLSVYREYAVLRAIYLTSRASERAMDTMLDVRLVRWLRDTASPLLEATITLLWLAARETPGWSENFRMLRQALQVKFETGILSGLKSE